MRYCWYGGKKVAVIEIYNNHILCKKHYYDAVHGSLNYTEVSNEALSAIIEQILEDHGTGDLAKQHISMGTFILNVRSSIKLRTGTLDGLIEIARDVVIETIREFFKSFRGKSNLVGVYD